MKIINQNAFDKWDIPDESIQAIITSPPYWNKRIYDGNEFTKPLSAAFGGKNPIQFPLLWRDFACGT